MNKIKTMLNHIKARQTIGLKYTLMEKIVGTMKMMLVPSKDIKAATQNILNGNVKYNPKTGFITIK